MAEEKKSFVLYTDLIHTVRKMPKEKQGELFMTILSYVNDENPTVDDLIVELVFEPIKLQMKRDLVKYETSKERRKEAGRIAGLKSGESRKKEVENLNQNEPNRTNRTNRSKNEPNEHVTVNVNGNVTVNGNLKILNSFLLSEIKISHDNNFFEFGNYKLSITEKDKINFKTAVWFQKLFIKNLKEKNAPTIHQEKATYKNYVTPIRLMFEVDKITQEQIKLAYEYLNSLEGEFWKKQILSTETLRKQIQKILIQKNTSNGKESSGYTKKPAKFSVVRATETLRADAERKQQQMEARNT